MPSVCQLACEAEGTKMKINSKEFRVRPGKKFKLKEWPTTVKPFFKSKKEYQKLLEEHVRTALVHSNTFIMLPTAMPCC